MDKKMIFGLFLVFLIPLLCSEGAVAASCAISQTGSDSGTVMQGEPFIVEVSGLSTSSTVEAQLMLPSGFSVDEDTTKTKSGVSSISWTTVQATDTKEGQSISVSLTIDNVPQGEVSCSPDPFDVVTKPNLEVASVGSPDPASLDEGSTFTVDLNIQNNGGTTADLSVGVSGPGMSKVSDTLPAEIDPDGNVAGTVTIKADEPGDGQTATITSSATNYGNTVDGSVNVDVNEITEEQPPSNGGTPGGGPAGGLVPVASQSKTWVNITPGVVKRMEINESEKLGVKEISLSVKNKANNVKITVKKQEGRPADVSVNVSGRAYRYLNIQVQNLNDSNIEEAKIQFEVNRSWIQENNIDPAKVYLYRYTDGEWNRLNTSKVSETSAKVSYEARTPGFSYFAVSGEEKTEEPELDVCPTCPDPSEWSECANGTQTRINYRCSEETDYICESYQEERECEAPGEKEIPRWWIVVVVIIVAILVISATVMYYRTENMKKTVNRKEEMKEKFLRD